MKSGNWFGNIFMWVLTMIFFNFVQVIGGFLGIFGAWYVGNDWAIGLYQMGGLKDIKNATITGKYRLPF